MPVTKYTFIIFFNTESAAYKTSHYILKLKWKVIYIYIYKGKLPLYFFLANLYLKQGID